jgi:hypothetical protein
MNEEQEMAGCYSRKVESKHLPKSKGLMGLIIFIMLITGGILGYWGVRGA